MSTVPPGPGAQPGTSRRRERKARVVAIPRRVALLGAGVFGSTAMLLSANGTLAAFTATITNDSNNAAIGSLSVVESDTATTCTAAAVGNGWNASCGIDKYGGLTPALLPGTTRTQAVTISNDGVVPITAANVSAAACTPTTPAGGSDPCQAVMISLVHDGTTEAATSAASLTSWSIAPIATGTSKIYQFVVALPSSAGNSLMGGSLSQKLVWTFSG